MLSNVQRVLQSRHDKVGQASSTWAELNVMQSAPKGHYRMLSLMLDFLQAETGSQAGDLRCLFIQQPGRQAASHSLAMSFGFVALNSLVLTAFSCCESQWLHLHSSASLLLLSLLLLLFSASPSRPFKSFNRGACIVICLQLACPPLFIIRSCVWEDQLPSLAWPGMALLAL